MDSSEIAAVASAVAALAAWAAVAQTRGWQRRTLEPRLFIQVSEVMVSVGPNRVRVRVQNVGGGFAHEARLYVRQAGQALYSGLPPTGALGPGESVVLMTGLTASDEHDAGIVIWRNGPWMYAADIAGRRIRWHLSKWRPRWRRRPTSDVQVAARFYRDLPPLAADHLVGYELET